MRKLAIIGLLVGLAGPCASPAEAFWGWRRAVVRANRRPLVIETTPTVLQVVPEVRIRREIVPRTEILIPHRAYIRRGCPLGGCR